MLIAACTGATALPASATPTDEAPTAQFTWEGDGTFKVHQGIELGTGTITEKMGAKVFEIREDANHAPSSIHFESIYRFSGKAAFPIRQLGQVTNYWLQAGAATGAESFVVDGTCEVFEGEPGTPGAEPVWTSPFECVTTRHGADNDFDFTVRLAGAKAEASGTIHSTGPVSLTGGDYPDNGMSFFVKGADSIPASGQTRFSSVLRDSDPAPASKDTRAAFKYAIVDNGAVTHYTVFGWNNSRGEQGCTVLPVGKYSCTVEGHSASFTHWDSTFIVGLSGVLAEASGTITPTNVTVQDGVFRTEAGYYKPGAARLSAGESTRFDTMLLEGDDPFYANQARMEWAYQIVDDEGTATGVWVAGLATNHRGALKFTGDGRCAIYASNPLRGNGRLDDAQPIEGSAYTCSATGEMLHGPGESDNRHFDGTYTVTKK